MTHAEFVAAHGRGELKVEIEPKAAARYLSARLLLPFVAMPVLGIGVALALVGWIATGLSIIAAGIIVPHLIKRNAPHFLLQQALQDAGAYEELMNAGLMRVTAVRDQPKAEG